VAQLHVEPEERCTQTHPSVFPALLFVTQTPLHGAVQVPPFATPDAHVAGVVAGA